MKKFLFIFLCVCFSIAHAEQKTKSFKEVSKIIVSGMERATSTEAAREGAKAAAGAVTKNTPYLVPQTNTDFVTGANVNAVTAGTYVPLGTVSIAPINNVSIQPYYETKVMINNLIGNSSIPYTRAPISPSLEVLSSLFHNHFVFQLKQASSFIVPDEQALPETTPVDPPIFRMHLFGGAKYASGFAMEVELTINGKIEKKILGFSAGHVGANISMDPAVTLEMPDGELITAPIEKWYNSNKNGSDLMAFEIPEEIMPYVQVLRPSSKLLWAGDPVEISGYSRGIRTQLHDQKVLLSSSQRYVVQHTNSKERTGMCGSPVIDPVTGEVVGIYVGFNFLEELRYRNWFHLLPENVQKIFTDVHYVVPIQNALSVAQALQADSDLAGAVPMKVMGFTVAPLYPNEYILSLALLRDGLVKETLNPGVLTDVENLEKFFELQENDVIRITVNRPQTPQNRIGETTYDINVSTGEVTKRDIRPGVF